MNDQRVVNAKVVGNKSNIWNKILLALVLVCVGAAGMYGIIKLNPGTTVVNKLEKEVTVNENGIADAVEKLYDAVVVVQNYQKNTLASSGTGFVYKTDGDKAYILTNAHVVSGASSVKLIFTNNKTFDAEIVGSDTYSDIAILSVNKDNIIQVAEIGSYQDARLGDTLFTIGAPLDTEYSWTVTRGILSGKERLVEISQNSNTSVDKWVMKVMQTDAAINSGNSGGPIANSNGEVIGITNMKLVSSGVEGMGFAIPIEDAIKYAEKLIESGKIERPVLGVGTLDTTDTLAMKMQYGFTIDESITEGAVVGYTQKGSVAEKAGLEKGDVIIKFGDYEIKNSSYLKYYLYMYSVGDKVKCTYIRGTKEYTVTLNLNKKAS